MLNKSQRAFTMVEMVVAMVIIGAGLAGVLSVLSRTSIFSAAPMGSKQMTAIAEGMLEEVLQKPFESDGVPLAAGCDRTAFNDIQDYNNYTNMPVCDVTGAPGPAGYTVSVNVANASGTILTGGIPASDACLVTVTVKKGSDSYSIQGWRLNYGKAQK